MNADSDLDFDTNSYFEGEDKSSNDDENSLNLTKLNS